MNSLIRGNELSQITSTLPSCYRDHVDVVWFVPCLYLGLCVRVCVLHLHRMDCFISIFLFNYLKIRQDPQKLNL